MAQMSPEEMQAMQAQAGKEVAPDQVSKLVQALGAGISKLSEVISGGGAATEKDMAMLQQLEDVFSQLVSSLEQGPGEDVAQQGITEAPMEGGLNGQPVGPQTRN